MKGSAQQEIFNIRNSRESKISWFQPLDSEKSVSAAFYLRPSPSPLLLYSTPKPKPKPQQQNHVPFQMYYYQRHRNDGSISKYTLETICNAIEFPPGPQPWEDFLDFSRMKFPNNFWTITCRIHKNCFACFACNSNSNSNSQCRFKGNYISIWMYAIIFAGAFVDWWYWISLGILLGVWILICICTVNPEYAYIQSRGINLKKQKYNGIGNERVSPSCMSCCMLHVARCGTVSQIKIGSF